MEIEAVKTSYARWAPIYDRTFGAATNIGRRTAVEYINAKAGPKVLEVGVGTGMALPFYSSESNVTGIDFSEDMLAKAHKKMRERKLSHVAELRQMDARALDFEDGHFDAVAAMHIMSVVPEPDQVVREMARVCKPGGLVVISNHFSTESGILSIVEKRSAPFANLLGWHSDFEISNVLGEPSLEVVERSKLPPMGMMTLLVMRKKPAE